MGKVVSIANQKGGVGKTTTAINLSACISALEKKVLVIDIDPQANTTSGLGLNKKEIKENNEPTIYDLLLTDEEDIEDYSPYIRKTKLKYLDVIPSESDLAGAEIELASVFGREMKLKIHIDRLKDIYDYIFIDCPPSLGLLTVNSFVASDSVLIPIQTEYFALEGLADLLNTIKIIQKRLNKKLTIEGILLTMFDSRVKLAKQVANEIKEWFGDKVYNTIIPKNVRLAEAPSHGKPIILYDILSTGAESYMKLAKEFLRRNRDYKK